MSSNFHHDLLEFGWSDKPIVIGIKVPKSLTDPFAPEAFEELGEFLESDNMVPSSLTLRTYGFQKQQGLQRGQL